MLIEGCSEIDERYQEDLGRFLRICARGELHNLYNLRFNYSGILPILTASGAVSSALLEECDRIANGLLDSGVEFENLTEVVEKILEIYPEATSEIVNKVLMRCAAVALRREDENAEKIIEFYGKVKNNYTYSLTVYFIMKQVENIQ